MADKDAERVEGNGVPNDVQGELLKDSEGKIWLVNNEYYQEQLERNKPSTKKEIQLQIARELLQSEVKRLTQKQQDIIRYKMMRLTLDEIAVRMNIEVTTVRDHLNEACKKLAKIINGTTEVIMGGLQNEQRED